MVDLSEGDHMRRLAIIGDARLTLEHGPAQTADLLVVDAFSSSCKVAPTIGRCGVNPLVLDRCT